MTFALTDSGVRAAEVGREDGRVRGWHDGGLVALHLLALAG